MSKSYIKIFQISEFAYLPILGRSIKLKKHLNRYFDRTCIQCILCGFLLKKDLQRSNCKDYGLINPEISRANPIISVWLEKYQDLSIQIINCPTSGDAHVATNFFY